MNPLLSYAVKSLRKNRTRTIVTIIGIMMSAALTVALATFGTSLYHYAMEGYSDKSGDWHLGIVNGPKQDVEQLRTKDGTENAVLAKSIGYAKANTADPNRPYLYLQGVGPAYYDHMPVHLTEGRLPEREGELLLPENFRGQSTENWMAGSPVTLEVGLRLTDGQALWQYIPYEMDGDGVSIHSGRTEVLQQLQEQSYTVVGFYEMSDGNSMASADAPGYTALTWWDGQMEEDGYNRYSLWFQISDVGNDSFHKIYDELRLVYHYNGLQLPVNLGLLSLYGVRISASGETTVAIVAAAVLLLIILVGSVMLIYNAFTISVGERTKQFGLLSSIGATRKQMRQSVLCEAAVVSVIGIPLGVCVGIACVALALKAAGETIAGMMEFSVEPHLYVWLPAVLMAMALAMLTVLVSASIPARRATKVTAIEAIRQNRDIYNPGKRRKVPKLVERLFGYEGTLAILYSRRNRKRYRVATIALALSLILFVSISTFSSYMMTAIETEYKTTNYDVLVQFPSKENISEVEQRDIQERLRGLAGVDSVTRPIYLAYQMPLSENEGHVTEDFSAILADSAGTGRMSASISVVDDVSFLEFCHEYGLDEQLFLDSENLTVIVKNNFKTTDSKSGNTKLVEGLLEKDGTFYVDLASDHYYLENYQPDVVKFTAGYYAESLAPGCNDGWNLSIMVPERLAEALGLRDSSDNTLTYCLTTSNHRKAAEAAQDFLSAKYPDSSVYDLAEKQAGNRNMVFLLRLLSNGFMIMIAVISVANVFSTISSSLKLRRQEFAMLKTVGMTQRGLRYMMNLECLLYGGKAVLLGLPVSVLAAAVMYYFFRRDVIFSFHLPVGSILIAIGSIFGVVFITMLYTMGRMKKESVIDALKQDSF